MGEAMFYDARYLIDRYTLADALRPQPGWGSKTRRVCADGWPVHNDAEVIEAARAATPRGYWLQRVEAIGGEPHIRVVMALPVPVRSKQDA